MSPILLRSLCLIFVISSLTNHITASTMTPSIPSHSVTTAASVSAAAASAAVVPSDSSPRTMAMITRTLQPDKGIIMTRLAPTAELPPPQQTSTDSLQGSGLINSKMDDLTLSKPTKCLTNVSRQGTMPGKVFSPEDSFSSLRETERDLDEMNSSAIQSDNSDALSKENTSSFKRRATKNHSKMNASVFKADESDVTPQTHRLSYKRQTDRTPDKNDTGLLQRDHTDNISHTNNSIFDGQTDIHLDKNSTDVSQSGHTNITPQANDSVYKRRTDRHFNKNDTVAFRRDYTDNIPNANGSISKRKTDRHLNGNDTDVFQKNHTGAISHANGSAYERQTDRHFTKNDTRVFQRNQTDIAPQTNVSNYKTQTDRHFHKNDTSIFQTDQTDIAPHTNGSGYERQTDRHINKNNTDNFQRENTSVILHGNSSDYEGLTDRHLNKNNSDISQRDKSNIVLQSKNFGYKWKANQSLNIKDVKVFLADDSNVTPRTNSSGYKRWHDERSSKINAVISDMNTSKSLSVANFTSYRKWITNKILGRDNTAFFPKAISNNRNATNDSSDGGRFSKEDVGVFKTDPFRSLPSTTVRDGVNPTSPLEKLPSTTERRRLYQNNSHKDFPSATQRESVYETSPLKDIPSTTERRSIHQINLLKELPSTTERGGSHPTESYDGLSSAVKISDMHQSNSLEGLPTPAEGRREHQTNVLHGLPITERGIQPLTKNERSYSHSKLSREDDTFRDSTHAYDAQQFLSFRHANRTSIGDPPDDISERKREGVGIEGEQEEEDEDEDESGDGSEGEFGQKSFIYNSSNTSIESDIIQSDTGAWTTRDKLDAPNVIRLGYLTGSQTRTMRRENSNIYRRSISSGSSTSSSSSSSNSKRRGDEYYRRPGQAISGALSLAVAEINSNPSILPEHRLEFIPQETYGEESESIRKTTLLLDANISAYIGPQETCLYEARIAAVFNVPMLSYYCSDYTVSDKQRYPTFIRTKPTEAQISQSVASLLLTFQWTKVTFVYSDEMEFQFTAEAIVKLLEANNIAVTQQEMYDGPYFHNHVENPFADIVSRTYVDTRIYVMLGQSYDFVGLMSNLYERGLLDSGEYFVVGVYLDYYDYSNPAKYLAGTFVFQNLDLIAVAFKYYIGVIHSSPMYPEYTQFTEQVNRYLQLPPFNHHNPYDAININKILRPEAAYLYDAVKLYADAAHLAWKEGQAVDNGQEIFNRIQKRTFKSASGLFFRINSDGDVEGNFSLVARRYTKSKGWGLYPVGVFLLSENLTGHPTFHLYEGEKIMWPDGKAPPLDEPPCGYRGERCIPPKNYIREIIGGVVGGIAVVIIVFLVVIYRNWKYEQDLASLLWKIDYKEITFREPLGTTPTQNYTRVGVNEARHLYTRVGTYRGQLVAIRHVNKKQVELTRAVRKELKIIRELRHPNINPFIGACVDGPYVLIISEYCSKGSLQDILENEELQLDRMFTDSLVHDIILGMSYLHDSEVKSHGKLKSSNCVVDSRWVLKVTDFGLHQFMADAKDDIGEFAYHRKIIERVRRPHNGVPFRPRLAALETIERCTTDVIKECWDEEPNKRPDFKVLRHKLKPMLKGMKSNIFDNMVAMMEKYASNLEAVIQDRTGQLIEEKKKTEELLLQMLPRSVAEQLKRGKKVEAEMFDSVTIYLSDICGFTAMSSESTPMQVVNTASRMESTGQPLKIHCSQQCKELLDQLGGYEVEERGIVHLKVSHTDKGSIPCCFYPYFSTCGCVS
eukprot:XP_014773523.1 PREDICTED: uncharacterized protein LOC106871537 [Octopus bimaculoides]